MTTDRLLEILTVMKADPADYPRDPEIQAWVRGRNTALESVAKQARLEEFLLAGIPEEAGHPTPGYGANPASSRAAVMERAERASEVGDMAYLAQEAELDRLDGRV